MRGNAEGRENSCPRAAATASGGRTMRKELKDFILATLDENRIMAIATVRRDGAPQTTLVGFAHDGLILYFFTDRHGQKSANIEHDSRVSIAIGQDRSDPGAIRALSLGGNALLVEDDAEVEHARKLLWRKFPDYEANGLPDRRFAVLMRVTPEVISAIDYSKGIGYAELAKVSGSDLDDFVQAHRRHWVGKD